MAHIKESGEGMGMGGKTPLMVVRELGYDRGEEMAVFPTVCWTK